MLICPSSAQMNYTCMVADYFSSFEQSFLTL